eukprot:CAMPEP_0172762342 /NCGR_PEP_ID=MMETSP1074-20121228/173304_1 /TAXON_ID=2916 /ORGANISM="Ceratium fusus, Strain PA161109" /LENGTH=117 /DNA_ID=CAMNT_0013596715 /DNA_START=392 /DNA_END=746 /DNA_ORIENTATION=-
MVHPQQNAAAAAGAHTLPARHQPEQQRTKTTDHAGGQLLWPQALLQVAMEAQCSSKAAKTEQGRATKLNEIEAGIKRGAHVEMGANASPGLHCNDAHLNGSSPGNKVRDEAAAHQLL